MHRLYITNSVFHANEMFFLYALSNIFKPSILRKEFYFIYPSSNVYPKENTNANVHILEFYSSFSYCKISDFFFPLGKYI